VGEEVQLFDTSLYQELISERQILALTDLINHVDDPVREPQVTRLLENFVASNPNILYLTAVGPGGKGTGAGNFRPIRILRWQGAAARLFRLFAIRCLPQRTPGHRRRQPACVRHGHSLHVNDKFSGMLAAVVSLDSILNRLVETSVRGRTVFVVDHAGHVIAHPDSRHFVPGSDLRTKFVIVAQVSALPKDLRTTETVQRFNTIEDGKSAEMIGTYSTIPDLGWAVVAQRSSKKLAKTRA